MNKISAKNTKSSKEKALYKKQKVKKEDKIFTIFDIIFIACFIVVSILGFVFARPLDRIINNIKVEQSYKITVKYGVKAHILNVGQAECILVELPQNKLLMYDTGLQENGEYISNYITKNIKTNVIDYLILSHTDSDHIGGAITILNNFEVKTILRPFVKSAHKNYNEISNLENIEKYTYLNDELYANVLSKIYSEKATVYLADYKEIDVLNNVFDGEDYNIEFYLPQYYKSSNANDFSSVITITHMGQTLMIAGDATERTEKNLLKNYSIPDVDFLVIAHHGSSTSSTFEFLQKVKPEYIYISAGKDNSYNHPSVETLNKLNFLGVKEEHIYLTSTCNDVILAFNGKVVENYFDAAKIKTNFILIGLILVVAFSYLPKIKKIIKVFVVKIKRNRLKTK